MPMIDQYEAVELPISKPLYSTYHYEGNVAALIQTNPTVKNWYLNNAIDLQCSRDFLFGKTSPFLKAVNTSWESVPNVTGKWFETKYLNEYTNDVIKNLLNDGLYVYFRGADDYFIKGKSWFNEKHFNHDGLICGYDNNSGTYSLYAYDSNWVYQLFKTTQESFNNAIKQSAENGCFCEICGIHAGTKTFEFNIDDVYLNMIKYMDSSFKKYPPDIPGDVFGFVVHDYLNMYIDKLYDKTIPHEHMDRRVFRTIWEHKKNMLERIVKSEETLELSSEISNQYCNIVKEANLIRMQYATHHMKERYSLLPIIKKELSEISSLEYELLTKFLIQIERKI